MPDERLITLLELRPDLAQPPPGSIAALAARAQARQSVKAATEQLDFLRLAVLDALLVLLADTEPVPIAKLVSLIGERATQAELTEALTDLKLRALAWGDTTVRIAADAGTALPWHPGQATRGQLANRRANCRTDRRAGPAATRRAGQTARGSPMGRTRDAAPGAARTDRCRSS